MEDGRRERAFAPRPRGIGFASEGKYVKGRKINVFSKRRQFMAYSGGLFHRDAESNGLWAGAKTRFPLYGAPREGWDAAETEGEES